MKKSIFSIAVGCIAAAILSTQLYAQGSSWSGSRYAVATIKIPPQVLTALSDGYEPMPPSGTEATAVNAKATKDFTAHYKGATNVKWYAVKDGFVSYFTMDGYGDRVYYNTKGRWIYTLKFYDEPKLPGDLRQVIRHTYPDLSISIIEELTMPEVLLYFVHLEDSSTIKIIKVFDNGDIEEMDNFKKS